MITCRTPDTQCPATATIYAIYGCINSHIYEIAVCDRHYDYSTIYGQPCRICQQLIEANEYLRLDQVHPRYQRNYINETRHLYRGGIYIG